MLFCAQFIKNAVYTYAHFDKYQGRQGYEVYLRCADVSCKTEMLHIANLRFKGYNKYDGRTETENIHCTRKRLRRRKSSKPQKLILIGIAAAVTIGAFLTLLNIEKQIDADSASSVQESETTATTAYAVAVNDIAEPEKIALP